VQSMRSAGQRWLNSLSICGGVDRQGSSDRAAERRRSRTRKSGVRLQWRMACGAAGSLAARARNVEEVAGTSAPYGDLRCSFPGRDRAGEIADGLENLAPQYWFVAKFGRRRYLTATILMAAEGVLASAPGAGQSETPLPQHPRRRSPPSGAADSDSRSGSGKNAARGGQSIFSGSCPARQARSPPHAHPAGVQAWS